VDDTAFDACDPAVADEIRGCVEDVVAEEEDVLRAEAFDYCVSVLPAELRDSLCESAWRGASPSDWCYAPADHFVAGVESVCEAELAGEFEPLPAPTITFSYHPLPHAVEEDLEQGREGCYGSDSCDVTGWGNSYGAPTGGARVPLGEIALAVQHRLEAKEDWSFNGSVSRSSLESHLGSFYLGDVLGHAEDAVAGPVELGRLSRSYYVAAGAEAWTSVYLLHFYEAHVVIVISVTSYET
jgi:hypothetical protein